MMNKSFRRLLTSIFLALVVFGSPEMPRAQADSVLAIDLNGAYPLALKTPAKDVIVANPGVIDVALQSPDHLVIIGKQPGRTRLMILDGRQKVVLNQIVIVTEGDAGMVSVYGARKGVVTQDDYACGYHCTIIPGAAPSGVKGGGSSGGARSPSSDGADTTAGDAGDDTAAVAVP